MNIDELTGKVIGSAIDVHRALGPGLLESTYEQCLARELSISNIDFSLQQAIPVEYKGVCLDCGYRIDILVENMLIVELKAVQKLLDIHTAQLLTYLKLAQIDTGLLINFNVPFLKDGIKRLRN